MKFKKIIIAIMSVLTIVLLILLGLQVKGRNAQKEDESMAIEIKSPITAAVVEDFVDGQGVVSHYAFSFYQEGRLLNREPIALPKKWVIVASDGSKGLEIFSEESSRAIYIAEIVESLKYTDHPRLPGFPPFLFGILEEGLPCLSQKEGVLSVEPCEGSATLEFNWLVYENIPAKSGLSREEVRKMAMKIFVDKRYNMLASTTAEGELYLPLPVTHDLFDLKPTISGKLKFGKT